MERKKKRRGKRRGGEWRREERSDVVCLKEKGKEGEGDKDFQKEVERRKTGNEW